MKIFNDYFSDDKIIFYLCRIRAKYAKQRSKKHLIHLLSNDQKYNYHLNAHKPGANENEEDELSLLNSLLPSRRNWKKLKKASRYQKKNQRINTVDYNIKSLLVTIDYYRTHKPNESFLCNLDSFIKEIRESVNNPEYKIKPPSIIPKLKGKKRMDKNVCRPISLFTLKDRLIIGFTNKYLTEIFDDYFYEKSFAFRAVKILDKKRTILTHHDAIQSILDYKKDYSGDELYVSECDISKFYDSVHHTRVKILFKRLINKIKKDNPHQYDVRAERIFYKYLESYSFTRNVLPYNEEVNRHYWEEKKIPNGSFGWVKEELLKLGYFKNIKKANIGVPQGGAISGLIANIVLDYSDKQVLKSTNSQLHYVRFCDDMVMIHPSKEECENASKVYYKSLQKSFLIPHDFQNDLINSSKSFWSDTIKSKAPYKWSNDPKNSFPWFGFVGYEIHYSGSLRVRKKSLKKEKEKQREVVSNILNAVRKGKRKSDWTIVESAANRLIGMSVGRINLTNFKEIENEMCWVTGFNKLKNNDQLRTQIKRLDNYRTKQLSTLIKVIKEIKISTLKEQRITICKFAFLTIYGLTEKDSEIIRNQLVIGRVLNSKFQLVNEFVIEDGNMDLGLSDKYREFQNEIIEILKNPIDRRKIVHYGKPFSYYYHIIEKNRKY
ncbi:MAG TPA: reverse transcriptase domain-containing protein [Prolixibacteraceae bacterium]|nr:reverse transcriptase domain-containing protein [Prolixibacteraceae bacterium]